MARMATLLFFPCFVHQKPFPVAVGHCDPSGSQQVELICLLSRDLANCSEPRSSVKKAGDINWDLESCFLS